MINILHITGGLEKNGTETFLLNLYRNIDRALFNFDFLIFSESEEGYYSEVRELGAKVYKIPSRRNSFMRYKSNLKKFMQNNIKSYHAVHFSGCSLTTILPMYYAKKFGCKKIIVHSHSTQNIAGIHNKILHSLNRKFISNIATEYLACSEEAARWFYDKTPAFAKRVIVKNGIDLKRFNYNPQIRCECRRALSLENKLVIGNISRFDPVKNHEFIVSVFYHIQKLNKNAVLLLIGEGPTESRVLELIKHKGLNSKCILLGQRDDIPELLNCMDLILFPSFFEGIPFSLIEAQAASLPIIASTGVSQDVNITNLVTFLDLDIGVECWARKALEKAANSHRTCKLHLIQEAGYDINTTVDTIQEIYSS